MKKIKLLKLFFFSLAFVWFVLSVLRTFYNFSKSIVTDFYYLQLTSVEKRVESYGEEFAIFDRLQDSIQEDSRMLFVVDDLLFEGGFYYKALYFLYPREVEVRKNAVEELSLDTTSANIIVFIGNAEKTPETEEFEKHTLLMKFVTQNYQVIVYKHE